MEQRRQVAEHGHGYGEDVAPADVVMEALSALGIPLIYEELH